VVIIWVSCKGLDEIDEAKTKEQDLRQTFLTKKAQAVKISTYQQQMIDIEQTFGALLKQLPDKSQMDGLLTDINQAGLGRNLEFELFKPGQEKVVDFYAEMPIQIKIKGSYDDMGAFATDISKLSRIVTLNDVNIAPLNKDSKDSKDSTLLMEATAKTYRYLDAAEIAAQQADAMKANKK
jgi:type IV pilus assembly protein PilO